MTEKRSDAYREAGVDIDAGEEAVARIAPLAAGTRIPGAIGGIGGFGGVFDLEAAGFAAGSPQLVSGADGVGTKLKIAFALDRHDTIGIDCVAMCVNDILTIGARPLFFLDYLATGRLAPTTAEAIVRGVAEGCQQSGCWLMGGETAEMPGMYAEGEYDLAGFVVGALTPERRVEPSAVRAGDVVLGLASSGVHSNGFSLVRRALLDRAGLSLDATPQGLDRPLGETLLTPTRIYVKAVEALLASGIRPHAMAHITGGGLVENPQRSLPDTLSFQADMDALRSMVHPVFPLIQSAGSIAEAEMYRVFNMGIGYTIVVAASDADAALTALASAGEVARVIGEIVPRGRDAGVILPGLVG